MVKSVRELLFFNQRYRKCTDGHTMLFSLWKPHHSFQLIASIRFSIGKNFYICAILFLDINLKLEKIWNSQLTKLQNILTNTEKLLHFWTVHKIKTNCGWLLYMSVGKKNSSWFPNAVMQSVPMVSSNTQSPVKKFRCNQFRVVKIMCSLDTNTTTTNIWKCKKATETRVEKQKAIKDWLISQ